MIPAPRTLRGSPSAASKRPVQLVVRLSYDHIGSGVAHIESTVCSWCQFHLPPLIARKRRRFLDY